MFVELLTCLLPTTWVVDSQLGAGAHFADLPAAVAAAAHGDTILVRAGTYTGVQIAGKALTIRGAGLGATVLGDAAAARPNRVANAPGLTVLAGLRIDGSDTGLLVQAAQVLLLDCELHGGDLPLYGGTAIDIGASGHVTANRCAFFGGHGLSQPIVSFFEGGRAVGVGFGATFVGDRCTLRGGDAPAPVVGQHRGGVGLAVNGEARLDRSQSRGGDGATQGGTGAFAAMPAHLRIVGGAGALLEGGLGAFGVGAALQDYFATIVVHPPLTITGTFAQTAAFGPVFPSFDVVGTALPDGATDAAQPVVASYEGLVPNGAYFFAVGFAPAYSNALAPLADSELLLDLATGGGWIGVLDGAGRFQFSFVPLQLFGGGLGLPVFGQASSFDPVLGKLHTSNCDVRLYAL